MKKKIEYYIENNIGDKSFLFSILNKIDNNILLNDLDKEFLKNCETIKNTNFEKMLILLYNRLLFRNPTKFDFQLWKNKSFERILTSEIVEQFLIGSEEYKKLDNVREYFKKLQLTNQKTVADIKKIDIKKLNEITNVSIMSNPRGKTSGLYHHIGIYLTKYLLLAKVSANIVTISAAILGVLASIFIASSNFTLLLIGIFLVEFHFLLDISDGEVARFNLSPKPSGTYLDLLTHFTVSPILWMGLTLGFFNSFPLDLVIVIGLSIVVGTTMKLADYVLHYATIPMTIFWKGKLVKYVPSKPPKNLFSEKILIAIEKSLILGQPGSFHVVSFCAAGLLLGQFFDSIYYVLFIFLVIYSILLNLSWILSSYVKITNSTIERQFSP